MIVLGLDTTGGACSCALVDDSQILAHISEPIGRGHAERLAPMTQALLAAAAKTVADIDQIAVCTGPGSFTGLRVALAFAKGMALPRRIPVIGLSALHVHAAALDPEGGKDTTIFTDVRRGEICMQDFKAGQAIGKARTVKREAAHLDGAAEFSGAIATPIMAWLSMGLSAKDHPAAPLYSRAPDAKLPGGITP